MYQAKLKNDVVLNNGKKLYKGKLISALDAYWIFQETKKKDVYICPVCSIDVVCTKLESDLSNMKPNEKNPYFREKSTSVKHEESCPFKSKSNSKKPKNKSKIKSQTNYYSKLIRPYPKDSIISPVSSNTKKYNKSNSEKPHERLDSYTVGSIEPICDQYIEIKQKNPWEKLKEILSDYKLTLYPNIKLNYYTGFRYTKWNLRPELFRIYHGKLRLSIRCKDGFLLIFNPPEEISYKWKPIFTLILDRNISNNDYEEMRFGCLKDEKFLLKYSYCYVFGQLEDKDSYFQIIPEYLSWFCLKGTNRNETDNQEIFLTRESSTCEELAEKAAQAMLEKANKKGHVDISQKNENELSNSEITTNNPSVHHNDNWEYENELEPEAFSDDVDLIDKESSNTLEESTKEQDNGFAINDEINHMEEGKTRDVFTEELHEKPCSDTKYEEITGDKSSSFSEINSGDCKEQDKVEPEIRFVKEKGSIIRKIKMGISEGWYSLIQRFQK